MVFPLLGDQKDHRHISSFLKYTPRYFVVLVKRTTMKLKTAWSKEATLTQSTCFRFEVCLIYQYALGQSMTSHILSVCLVLQTC